MENIKKAQILKSLFAEVFRAVNAFGDTKATVAEILKRGDGVITKDFAHNVVVKSVQAMAENERYDGRNEYAVRMCKEICEKVFPADLMGIDPEIKRLFGPMVAYEGNEKAISQLIEKHGAEVCETLFATSVLAEHRTLQQSYIGACIKILADTGEYDFSALGMEKPWVLPLI